MTTLQIDPRRHSFEEIGRPLFPIKTAGVGRDANDLAKSFRSRAELTYSIDSTTQNAAPGSRSLPDQLFNALAAFKIRTAAVAMHLDRDWRDRLFAQLDSLLAADDWDDGDLPPTLASFQTFLRMLLFVKPDRRPGLGATGDGKLIATWTVGADKLTIECLPADMVRWNLSAVINGEKERAAAITPVSRLNAVLEPYTPQRWFTRAE